MEKAEILVRSGWAKEIWWGGRVGFIESKPRFNFLQSLSTSNQSPSGCDFHIKANDIVIIRGAEHNGRLNYYENPAKNLVFTSNFMTEAINMTKAATNLQVGVAERGRWRIFVFQLTQAEGKGFQSIAMDRIQQGFVNGMNRSLEL